MQYHANLSQFRPRERGRERDSFPVVFLSPLPPISFFCVPVTLLTWLRFPTYSFFLSSLRIFKGRLGSCLYRECISYFAPLLEERTTLFLSLSSRELARNLSRANLAGVGQEDLLLLLLYGCGDRRVFRVTWQGMRIPDLKILLWGREIAIGRATRPGINYEQVLVPFIQWAFFC